ncbi:MAG: DMT family transporter [Paracoccaceae bacterium]
MPVPAAIALSLTGVFLLDVMAVIVKLLSDRFPAWELATFRNLFGLIPCVILLTLTPSWRGSGRVWRFPRWPLAFLRGGFVIAAQVCFYLGLARLEFATAATLAFAMPLFVTLLSVPVLGARVGAWRWAAVAIGFAGIVLVMQPGTDLFTWAALLPVMAALGYASATITAKVFDPSVPSALINLYSTSTACLGATAITMASGGFVPVESLAEAGWIVAMGVVGGSGVLCLITAYRMTEASNLAPFDYFGILFAIGLGWAIFGEAPFDRLFPGALFVVAGGLIIVWRERQRARTPAPPKPTAIAE